MEKIDKDILIAAILILVLLLGVEGIAIGWAVNHAALQVSQVPRPDRVLAFARWWVIILAPFVALNAALGAWLAYRLSTPLWRIREALREVTAGNLEVELAAGPGELLGGYTQECRDMLQTLRRLIYRDRRSAEEVSALLAQGQELLREPGHEKKLGQLLTEARSTLSVVNHHFMKGRREEP